MTTNKQDDRDWSLEEVEATVADYLEMLRLELSGHRFNKAEHNRQLRTQLNSRSHGSVEFKHQNISAILIELGSMYIEGYKPLANYQDLLADVVAERLIDAQDLKAAADASVGRPVHAPAILGNLLEMLVAPPETPAQRSHFRETSTRSPRIGVDFLQRESEQRSLGRAGELLALAFERERLIREGKSRLSEKVEHVSEARGDGLGYDILSFESSGKERLIEVKTTRHGGFTPFFASRNEVAESDQRPTEYSVYRLFNFEKKPRLFILNGSMRATCLLTPSIFVALPASNKGDEY